MGVDHNVYVGCYIELSNTTKVIPWMLLVCCGRTHRDDSKFCSSCGKELVLTDTGKTEKQAPDFNEILGDDWRDTVSNINNYGTRNDPIVLIDNSCTGMRILEEGTFEMTEVAIALCKSKFLANTSICAIISKCEKAFGESNVEIKFGIVTYYS